MLLFKLSKQSAFKRKGKTMFITKRHKRQQQQNRDFISLCNDIFMDSLITHSQRGVFKI